MSIVKDALSEVYGSAARKVVRAADARSGIGAALGAAGLPFSENDITQILSILGGSGAAVQQPTDGSRLSGSALTNQLGAPRASSVSARGDDILEFQRWFNRTFDASIAEDGIYGGQTEGALNYAKQRGPIPVQLPSLEQAARDMSSSASSPAPQYTGAGSVSARYESGGRGAASISSGRGDPGGKSYGTHQLASRRGSLQNFVNSPECRPWAARLKSAPLASDQFDAIWRECARDPAFAQAQHDFIARTHYQPSARIAQEMGIPLTPAIQEALWSQGVQHGTGGSRRILQRAFSGRDPRQMSEIEIIRAIYAARTDYVAGLRSLPAATQRAVLNRYRREERDVLALVGREASSTTRAERISPMRKQAVSDKVEISDLNTEQTEKIVRESRFGYRAPEIDRLLQIAALAEKIAQDVDNSKK